MKIKFRPLLRVPPQTVVKFPPRSDDWDNTYPVVIKPWLGSVRAFWLDEQQAFQLEDGGLYRVDGIEPEIPDGIMDKSPTNVLGEFFAKNMDYDEIMDMVTTNTPIADLMFYIFDADMQANARERAKYCLQIPRNYPGHVSTAAMYEVYTKGGFDTYLDGWRRNYQGGLAVGSEQPWLATEYEVKTLI